ncbi:MAG TPA: adenylyltransferase/cytidyltransferase family protein, partial [Flavobacteriales bacterium]|nr:adenylyltransferase/cytidyltransferase family protein [Flavobacteriales bacterium]
MKIYNSIEEFSPNFKVVLTLGTFDGVHIGHQSILKQLNQNAKKIGGESTLLTFYPHPRHVLFPDDQNLKLLTTIEERSRMLENYGLK